MSLDVAMSHYYNEHDPLAAAWLRELIKGGYIGDGEVDERSIVDVRATDLDTFTQCHFFAGIGGWAYALRLAGWPDDRPVWTGSCPCQPFSSAGAQAGGDDPRHLWPAWFRLIRQCRPHVVFGEQVESALTHGWLDLVQDDLEREGYAVGPVGLPAACVGAPHIRQRLWFVAESSGAGAGRHGGASVYPQGAGERERRTVGTDAGDTPLACRAVGELADSKSGGQRVNGRTARTTRHADEREHPNRLGNASSEGLQERELVGRVQREPLGSSEGKAAECGSDAGSVGDTDDSQRRSKAEGRHDVDDGPDAGGEETPSRQRLSGQSGDSALGHAYSQREDSVRGIPAGPNADSERNPWADLEWLPCRDGKARPTQRGLFPLVDGISSRVGHLGHKGASLHQAAQGEHQAIGNPNATAKARVMRLRGYGNAVVPAVAAEVIRAFMEIE